MHFQQLHLVETLRPLFCRVQDKSNTSTSSNCGDDQRVGSDIASPHRVPLVHDSELPNKLGSLQFPSRTGETSCVFNNKASALSMQVDEMIFKDTSNNLENHLH